MVTKQVNVRLEASEMEDLEAQAASFNMNPTALAKIYLSAAIKTVKAQGNRVMLPIQFQVGTASVPLPDPALNEPKKPYGRK